MSKTYSQQKAALTRAINKPEGELRQKAVVKACKEAVADWNKTGWPDGWSRWQRALGDTFGTFEAPELESLR